MESGDIKQSYLITERIVKMMVSPNVTYSFNGSFNLSKFIFLEIIKFLQNINGNEKSYG